MASTEEKIREFEEELRTTKYNKRTQHHIGLVKAKLAKLKGEAINKAGGGGKGEGYAVRRSGDASAILLGFPSVGKSTILNKLTRQNSPVGAYAFTTLTVIPGMLEHKFAKIQILDVPGIVHGAATGKGRGREVLSCMRNADLILIVVDATQPHQYDALMKEVYDSGIRLDESPPDVKIEKTVRGGIDIGTTIRLTNITEKLVKAILREYKINNGRIVIRTDIAPEQLIDVLEKNRVYLPSAVVVNKIDIVSDRQKEHMKKTIKPDIFISANQGIGIDELKELIYKKLGFIRIYLKEVNKQPDLKEPLIMREGCTIGDVCAKLHKDFVKKFRHARVWGSSKFPGQSFRKLDKQLCDNDILEIHLQ